MIMMSFHHLCVVFLLGMASGAVLKNGQEIPTYAQVCTRSDPNLNECLKDSITTLIQKISKNGIKELGLRSLDPVFVPEVVITSNGTNFRFKSTLRNINVHGVSKVKIQQVRSSVQNKDNTIFEFDLLFPKIFIQGNYKTEGIVAGIPVGGKGVYNVSMVGVEGPMKVEGHVVTVDAVEYLKVDRVTIKPELANLSTYWENLIDGNPELTGIANMFFNQFWRGFYWELLPYTEEGIDKVWRSIINAATLKIPYDQLLPL